MAKRCCERCKVERVVMVEMGGTPPWLLCVRCWREGIRTEPPEHEQRHARRD